jgi:hypothetical protein
MANDTLPSESAARDPELLAAEADVERARARVAQSVIALRNEVARRADWREWVRRQPGLFVAGAFVAGFLWGRRQGAARSSASLKNRRRLSWR